MGLLTKRSDDNGLDANAIFMTEVLVPWLRISQEL